MVVHEKIYFEAYTNDQYINGEFGKILGCAFGKIKLTNLSTVFTLWYRKF